MKTSRIFLLALAALGLACGPKQPAETPEGEKPVAGDCASHEDCDPGLVCQAGLCLPYEGEVGDPCYDELDCAMGLDCKKGTCVEVGSDQ